MQFLPDHCSYCIVFSCVTINPFLFRQKEENVMEYLFTLCRRCIIMTDLIKRFSGYAEETGRISREREKEKKSRSWIM